MQIAKTLAVINQMQKAGVIGRYAIGGAVGATFYLEPVRTVDVDVFVAIEPEAGSLIITPQPIYEYLTGLGYKTRGEYILVEDWPVQFLPPTGPLLEEAIAQAQETNVKGEPTFVISAEHLMAIALETGRAKDKARILQFLEEKKFDKSVFLDILKRHRLLDRWSQFEKQFLTES